MSTHTPGPWHYYRTDHGVEHIIPCETPTPNTVQICTFNGFDRRAPAETRANALLIAAAPELLTALEGALQLIEADKPDWTATIRKSRAAIAKAKGEASR